jgi:carboxymethylenebutenolidase
MPRLTAKDFAAELLELYDGYVHGKLSRRQFLDRAALYAVGGLTAAGILASLSPGYALTAQGSFTDQDIVAEYITTPRPMATAKCAPTQCGRQTWPPAPSTASPMRKWG